MNPFSNRPPILVVDDRWEDTFLLQRLIRSTKTTHPVQTASGARQAVEWLQLCLTQGTPKPFLIFLDVGSPPSSGFDVLQWVRENADLKDITVVMLSASDEPSDRQKARELGAQIFLQKYPSSQTLAEIIERAAEPVGLSRAVSEFQPQVS